jgi:alpha-mannosidase
MRQNEALLASAERWAAATWWRFGRAYPEGELREAWKRLMFNTFHDTLCGSLVESAIPAVNAMFGYTGDVARRVITKAQLALLPPAEPTPDTIPLFVFNPHASTMRAPVGINFMSAYAPPPKPKAYTLYDDAGAPVPSQTQGGDNIHLDEGTWQPFCGFVADVPPMSVKRYEIRFKEPAPSSPVIDVQETNDSIRLETPFWSARFDRAAGALVELTHKATGRSLLRAPLCMMVMQDVSHAWGGENNVIFNKPVSAMTALSSEEVGAFAGMEGHTGPAVRVIARGDAWVTVECLVGWQHTRAAIRHTFYAELPYIDLHTQLYMQARRKMIKLQMPFALNECAPVCEVPYSVAHYPADATEYPYARWIRLDDAAGSVGIANNGQNGFDVDAKGTLNLSLSRGAFHCAWSETDVPTDKSYTIMDQERIDTRFRLLAGDKGAATDAALVLAAQELNQPLERFFVYYPPTLPEDAAKNAEPFVTVTPSSVVLAALKKAEGEDALIIRVQETVGTHSDAEIRVQGTQPLHIALPPFALRTFRLGRDGRWVVCNLLEEAAES